MYATRRSAIKATLYRLADRGVIETKAPITVTDGNEEKILPCNIDNVPGPIQVSGPTYGFIVSLDPILDAYMVTMHI